MTSLDWTITHLSWHSLRTMEMLQALMQTGKKLTFAKQMPSWPSSSGPFFLLSTLWNSILCRGVVVVSDRTWLDAGSVWLKVAPFGIRRLLNFIKNEYGNPPIIITENGVSERGPVDLKDGHRTYFYEKYINEVLKGIKASHSKKSKSRNVLERKQKYRCFVCNMDAFKWFCSFF